MRKKLFEFSNKVTSKEIYESLSKNEKAIIEKFRDYCLIFASPIKAKEGTREILRFRKVVGVRLSNIDLEDLRYFLKELKVSSILKRILNLSKS